MIYYTTPERDVKRDMFAKGGEERGVMGKFLRRLAVVVTVIVLLLAGGAWALSAYIAPERALNLQYERIDVKAKALDMISRLKPELVLSEADIDNLAKMNLDPEAFEQVRIDGADFRLEDDLLIADLNVTYKDRIPAGIQAVYRMEWQEPNLALRPQSLKVKDISLPLSMLETIIIPLELPSGDTVEVENVRFDSDGMKIRFKINLSF